MSIVEKNLFQCQYSGCSMETDRLRKYKGKKYCLECYKKIRKWERERLRRKGDGE